MATVVHIVTLQKRTSVNRIDFLSGDWLINPDTSALDSLGADLCVVDGGVIRAKTVQELDAELTTWKALRLSALREAVRLYGLSRYDPQTEVRLKHAYNRAIAEGLVNKAAYIRAALDWEDSLSAEYKARFDAIGAAISYAQVMAVSLDFSSFDATDPKVSDGVQRGIKT